MNGNLYGNLKKPIAMLKEIRIRVERSINSHRIDLLYIAMDKIKLPRSPFGKPQDR